MLLVLILALVVTVVNIQPYKCNFSLNQMGVWDDMHVNSKQLSIVRHAPEF
jgi:hypothetical protein